METMIIEDLRTALITGWEMVKQSAVDKLCASFPGRMQMCLDNERQSIQLMTRLFDDADKLLTAIKELCESI
jgi:hypothetical protein